MNTTVPAISPGKRAIRETALADLDGLKQRHPAAFAKSATRRILMIGLPLAMVLLAFGAMVWLDFSLVRIWNGLHRLGQFAVLMIPPAPEGRFMAFSIALGETLAIAFLGTLTAAILAFPVAFLAAKNVIPNIFVHFGARRTFDVFRSVDTLIWALMWINVVGLGPFAARSPSPAPISARSESCSPRRSRRQMARRPRASRRPAAARRTRSASGWCRRCCR